MEFIQSSLDVFLHVDQHLSRIIELYGGWVYAVLFLIVFCETGLVVTPFLPGDSLLFAAGALAALGRLELELIIVLLIVAAVVGDALNYSFGRWTGARALESRFLNLKHLETTTAFYERHGGRTIVLARFVPIVRTFAPFVAGMGRMKYSQFAFYNVGGALLWVLLFVLAGYAFGNVPVVKHNLTLVILGIVVASVLPPLIGLLRQRVRRVPIA